MFLKSLDQKKRTFGAEKFFLYFTIYQIVIIVILNIYSKYTWIQIILL